MSVRNAFVGSFPLPAKTRTDAFSEGTRVFHKHYRWMVGYVTESVSSGDHIMVLWEHIGGPCAELPADLRATPVQPQLSTADWNGGLGPDQWFPNA